MQNKKIKAVKIDEYAYEGNTYSKDEYGDRKNSKHGLEHYTALQKARELGGFKELALRSQLRADNKCACSQCECTKHDHEKKIKYENITVAEHCGNTSLVKCPECPKQVCGLCFDEHLLRHEENELKKQIKCDCSNHNEQLNKEEYSVKIKQGRVTSAECKYCPKKVCDLCFINHIGNHNTFKEVSKKNKVNEKKKENLLNNLKKNKEEKSGWKNVTDGIIRKVIAKKL